MNHQTFEEWLFISNDEVEDKLNSHQIEQLDKHLRTCSSCQQLVDVWKMVDNQLRASPAIAPAPGFSSRWQERLELDRIKQHERQTVVVLIGSAVLIVILLMLLVFVAIPWMQSPHTLLFSMFYRLFSLTYYIEAISHFLLDIFHLISTSIPSLTWWLLMVGLSCELAVLWIVSYQLFTTSRRIIR